MKTPIKNSIINVNVTLSKTHICLVTPCYTYVGDLPLATPSTVLSGNLAKQFISHLLLLTNTFLSANLKHPVFCTHAPALVSYVNHDVRWSGRQACCKGGRRQPEAKHNKNNIHCIRSLWTEALAGSTLSLFCSIRHTTHERISERGYNAIRQSSVVLDTISLIMMY